MNTIKKMLTLVFFLIICNFSFAQTTSKVSQFLKSGGGVELISTLAHPTNTFKSAEWSYSNNGEILTVNIVSVDNFFGGKVYTKVRFRRQGYFFTGLRVDSDTDSVFPFLATGVVKEILNDYIRDYNQQQGKMLSEFERYFNTTLIDMDAYQTSLVIISLAFLAS